MLERILRRFRDEPIFFVKELLNVTPDAWQAETLQALTRHDRIAIRSGHGVGKSCLLAWSALWFLFTRPHSKVVVTSPTLHQLLDIFMSECSKWLNQSALKELFESTKTKIFFKTAPDEWFLVARTASKPENLAGFHADNLLFILDEASGIDDAIFETILGALTGKFNRLIMCSNPTRNTGFFKRAFFEDRDLYHTLKVSSLDSGRVNKEYAAQLIKQYGLGSDVVRVRVLGEFPQGESDGLIGLDLAERATNRIGTCQGDVIIGVDVARFGDDETCIAIRTGDVIQPLITWRKCDLMTTCGRIVGLAKKYPDAIINVDDDGVGGGVTDRLREVLSNKIIGRHNGGRPRDNHYGNFATESWFALKELLTADELTLPQDEELIAQLTTRRYTLTSADKLILEPKSEFKKRYHRSPDRADAVVLTCAPTFEFLAPQLIPKKNFGRWSHERIRHI